MERYYFPDFQKVSADEAVCVIGGIDKGAQDALYLFGYVVGVIAKVFTSLVKLIKR